jgi:hypothetical protein
MSSADPAATSPTALPLRPPMKRFVWLVQALLLAAAVWTLADQLYQINASLLLQSVPRSAQFYLLFFAVYLALPVTDALIHRRFWSASFRTLLPVMLRKRVYNFAAFGYSGEAYVVAWARTTLHLPWRQSFSFVKDSALLSALASNFAAVSAIAAVLLDPRMALILSRLGVGEGLLWALASMCMALLIAPLVWRRFVMALSTDACLGIFAAHSLRLAMTLLGQIAIWTMLAPTVSPQIWFVLTAIYLVVSRLPFLPNRDLLFAAAALALAGGFGADESAIRTAVLVSAVLMQIAHALAFLLSMPLRPFAPSRTERSPRPVADR